MEIVPGDPGLFGAKFQVPTITASTVARPRLYKQLDQADGSRLVVITAPAGFGKTTLVAAWLQDRSRRLVEATGRAPLAAWLSLDERDNDIASLATHVVAAIQLVCADFTSETAKLLETSSHPDTGDLLRALLGDLAKPCEPLTLVLDDYHLIHEPLVHQLLELLIAYSPGQFHLILITRYDPPLPVARLCLQGKAHQLRAADLRFNREEVDAFFKSALSIEVPAETLTAVADQAGGWIAQLRLAALVLERASDQPNVDAWRSLAMDYLLEELLVTEPPEGRAFLLATSVLERFCMPLATALLRPGLASEGVDCQPLAAGLSQQETAAVLKRVVRAGLFVSEFGEDRTWYCYHELFRKMLFQNLLSECPRVVPLLRHRAFEWLAASGYIADALAQAEAGKDIESAAALIEENILPALERYEWQMAARWLRMLPPGAVHERPAFLLARGYMYANSGAVDRLGDVIQRVEQLLEEDARWAGASEKACTWRGTLELLRSEHALLSNEVGISQEAAERALAILPQKLAFERSLAVIRLGSTLLMAGKPDDARALVRDQLNQVADSQTPAAVRIRLGTAVGYMHAADLGDAKRELQLVEQACDEGPLYNQCWLHYMLGRIAYEWNDLDLAEQHLRIAAGGHGGNYIRACESFLGLALVHQVRGKWQEADKLLDQAMALARGAEGDFLASLVLSCRSRLALMRGRLQAVGPGPTAPASLDPGVLHLRVEVPGLTESWRLIQLATRPALQQAQHLLETNLRFFQEAHARFLEIPALCVMALLYEARDQRNRALATLGQAVRLAQPGRFVRVFLDYGPELIALLYSLNPAAADAVYLAEILAIAGRESGSQVETPPVQSSLGPDPLTNRERQVLELLAQHLSDKEIGRSLGISSLTVRKHTSNIFAKLQVNNRGQAGAKAIALGMVRAERPSRNNALPIR